MTEIQSVLPHQYPFLMIDRITEVEQGKWAKGFKNITFNEWFIAEPHYCMPSTMIVEALAQLGAFATTTEANRLGFLSSLKGVEFLGETWPGDRLDLYYEVVKNKRGFVVGKGEATVEGRPIVRAEEIMIYIPG